MRFSSLFRCSVCRIWLTRWWVSRSSRCSLRPRSHCLKSCGHLSVLIVPQLAEVPQIFLQDCVVVGDIFKQTEDIPRSPSKRRKRRTHLWPKFTSAGQGSTARRGGLLGFPGQSSAAFCGAVPQAFLPVQSSALVEQSYVEVFPALRDRVPQRVSEFTIKVFSQDRAPQRLVGQNIMVFTQDRVHQRIVEQNMKGFSQNRVPQRFCGAEHHGFLFGASFAAFVEQTIMVSHQVRDQQRLVVVFMMTSSQKMRKPTRIRGLSWTRRSEILVTSISARSPGRRGLVVEDGCT